MGGLSSFWPIHAVQRTRASARVADFYRFGDMSEKPSDLILRLAREAIDIAMKCVATGETLLPFIVTEGSPGKVISLAVGSSAEVLTVAQQQVEDFGADTKAFAFAYDGFIGAADQRSDCIYIEAGEAGSDKVFLFAQRYSPKKVFRAAKAVGNWVCLEKNAPRLKWRAEPSAGGNAASPRASA
jgi:hypothetical protein